VTACPVHSDSANPAWSALAARGVRRGLSVDAEAGWRLVNFSGRFAEISSSHSSASLTLMFRLVHEAQKQDEPVAWISDRESVFFPPDVAASGVDLEALAVIRAPGLLEAARAADQLMRSGAFGLLVMDIGANPRMPVHAQMRLVGLAKKHATALLCITEKTSQRPSIGSLVSLRAEALRTQKIGNRFECEFRVLKDKRRGPGWTHREVFRGPDGLC
jgi:recombination protein RecA